MRQQQRKAQRKVEEGGQRENRSRPIEHTIHTGTVAWPDRTQDSQHEEKAEEGQGRHSQCPCLRRLLLPATSMPFALAHHAKVVHEAGPMRPNVGRSAGQWLNANLLASVQLSDSAYHHVHSVKHQGCGQLSGKK